MIFVIVFSITFLSYSELSIHYFKKHRLSVYHVSTSKVFYSGVWVVYNKWVYCIYISYMAQNITL